MTQQNPRERVRHAAESVSYDTCSGHGALRETTTLTLDCRRQSWIWFRSRIRLRNGEHCEIGTSRCVTRRESARRGGDWEHQGCHVLPFWRTGRSI